MREGIEEKNYAEAEAEIVRSRERSSASRRWLNGAAADLKKKVAVRLVLLDGPNLLLRLLCGLSSRNSSGQAAAVAGVI